MRKPDLLKIAKITKKLTSQPLDRINRGYNVSELSVLIY